MDTWASVWQALVNAAVSFSGTIKCGGIWVAEDLLASQEELYSVELVI